MLFFQLPLTDGGMSMFFNRLNRTNMKAHEFIRETFDLDNRTSISELPNLPISLIVEMFNNYKEGKVKKLLIPRVVGRSEQLTAFAEYCDEEHGLFIPSWMIDGYNKSR
jgi:hypothetical protein